MASKLNDGQKDCLRLVMRHFSSKEIARQLGISPHTVDKRLKVATATLGVSSRVDAARILTNIEEKSGAREPAGAIESKQTEFEQNAFLLGAHRDHSLVYQRPDLFAPPHNSKKGTSSGELNPADGEVEGYLREGQAAFTSRSYKQRKNSFLGLAPHSEDQINDLTIATRVIAMIAIAGGSILVFSLFVNILEGLSRLY